MRVYNSTLLQTILLLTAFLSIHFQPLSAVSLETADTIRLKQHVTVVTSTSKPRNFQNTDILDSVAVYIKNACTDGH